MQTPSPEQIIELRNRLIGCILLNTEQMCAGGLKWTRVRTMSNRFGPLQLLAVIELGYSLLPCPSYLLVVPRCLAFRKICYANDIIVHFHILTSNGMIDYRIWAVYRWVSIIIWIITLPHKNSMAVECDTLLSPCISMKSAWYIKGYHLGNIFS